jgi:hypothetical protein
MVKTHLEMFDLLGFGHIPPLQSANTTRFPACDARYGLVLSLPAFSLCRRFLDPSEVGKLEDNKYIFEASRPTYQCVASQRPCVPLLFRHA